MTNLTVNLPFFPGFYESSLSQTVDYAAERESEYSNEKQSSQEYYPESYYPEQLRVDYQDFLWDCVNYGAAYREIAADYCSNFDAWMTENCETPAGAFLFESMDSPREYNFTTDRVYVTVDESVMAGLLARTDTKKLAAIIERRFTSRDGFISYYSNRLEDWQAKSLGEYDHNELGTILIAAIESIWGDEPDESDEFRWQLIESIAENDYQYVDNHCDWAKVETKAIEARGKKLAEWIKDDLAAAASYLRGNGEAGELLAIARDELDSDEIAELDEFQICYMESHYRCPMTIDMFP